MKKIYNTKWQGIFAVLLFLVVSACSVDELSRNYEAVKVVGVKVNNDLYTPQYAGNVVQIALPNGRDLSNVKLQLLVANGEAQNFENNEKYDARKPIKLSLKGANGEQTEVILKVQSPPALSSFIIEGVNVEKKDIYFGASSLIVQVPKGTNLKQLKVTMEFVNGTLQEFTNGVAADYTDKKTFKIKGVDDETIYPYDLIITTEQVGPASVRSMQINGLPTDSVVVVGGTTLVPYVTGLSDFTNSTVMLETGFGNRVDPAFTGQNLNLLAGNVKVKITGTDGIVKEFTIGRPQLSLLPVFSKDYASFGYGANDLNSVGFSGNYLVVPNYSAVAPTVVGPNYYDFTGQQVGVLNKTGVVIAHSLRKLATDTKGAILVVPLGLTDAEQTIYKWDNVTAAPVPYIKYSRASLGVDYTPRSAGINISGSLDGNAIITVGMAQKTDVFVWTVTGGVLNPTPTRYNFPFTGNGFYWSVEPMPIGTAGYVGAATGTNFNGIISLNSTMAELHKQTGITATDARVLAHKGRTYLAYTAYSSGKGAYFRVCDITDGQVASFQNPIMNLLMPSTAANANNTMDADMAVVNGKLHAAFVCTNIGMRLYKLEK
ncbi:hypothetical protein TH63_14600 [Rufibacter radiotolerans]|uniref:DUF5018 domain-containing protein n=1 Tax=Rufibacter radiotolerans TaxID=1379910 RepID=A0A0H4VRN5_9BACT|nr:hypothetical protein [Rufibacter radiotolerans]AKQ46582.1 hypothetical protein TH63_14600 [Rufibacter radiotolerans]